MKISFQKISNALSLFTSIIVGLSFLSCQETIEQRAEREAKEFTEKNCPTPIVDNSRIDSLTYDEETRTIHYYRTLFGNADNSEAISANQHLLHEELIKEFRDATNIKMYIEAGMSFKLTYRSASNTNQVLYETILTPDELQK